MDAPMTLVCCGVSHKTLALAERERLQPPRERWPAVLEEILRSEEILTAVLVTTCNRIEFYLKTTGEGEPLELALDALGVGPSDRRHLREAAYLLRGDDAVRHLFQVAAGLDSMSLGESEVLGQIKEAYSTACRCGTVAHVMHRLFHGAFRIGKQVRNATELGHGVRSLCGAALELAEEAGGSLLDRELLLIGINGVTQTVAARTRGLMGQTFLNRTHCKASAMARRFGGRSARLEGLSQALIETDVVFTSTSAPEPLLDPAGLEAVLRAREGRPPLIVCDLAVPRDLPPPAADDPRLVILDLDAVGERIRDEDRARQEGIEEAEELVDEHVAAFWRKLHHGELGDSAQALMKGARRVLERELGYCRRSRSPEEVALLEQFGRRLVDKVCGLGIVNIRAERERNGNGDGCRSTSCSAGREPLEAPASQHPDSARPSAAHPRPGGPGGGQEPPPASSPLVGSLESGTANGLPRPIDKHPDR